MKNQLILLVTLLAVSRYFYCNTSYYKKNIKSCYFDSKAAEGIKTTILMYMLLIIIILQVFPTN